MVIISEYTLECKEGSDIFCQFFVKSNDTLSICPYCKGLLEYRDRKLRIRKQEGGIKTWISIRRLKCSVCKHLHNELPDILAPYKHYEAELIAGVIDDVVHPDDEDSEDYPCQITMERWLYWFNVNLQRIEGYLRQIAATLHLNVTSVSLLEAERKIPQNRWLEKILKAIYNFGGFLPPG